MIDIRRVRVETPGADTAHHFNAAGSALPSVRTLRSVIDHLHLESITGGYEAAATVSDRLEAVYVSAARLLGAEADEIALVESATVGWHKAVDAFRLDRGDRVVVSRSTYVSCALHLLALERERGVAVEVLPNDRHGATDLDALHAALARRPRLLALTHVPTSSGLIEPIAEAGRLAREAEVPLIVDATQSVGQIPVDVRALGCGIAFTTGRKFLRGPRGTAILYVRADLLSGLHPAAPDVRGAEWRSARHWTLSPTARRFETWEASHALRLGLGAAIDELLELGVDDVCATLSERARDLRDALAELPRVIVRDPGRERAAIVTFTIDGMEARDVAMGLADAAVKVVAVPASHGQWDLGARDIAAVVRASPHIYNDDGDHEALVGAVARLAAVDEVLA